MQLGVKEQLDVKSRIVQSNGHDRSRAVTAELAHGAVCGDQAQYAVPDEAVEQMNQQPHWQRCFPNVSEFASLLPVSLAIKRGADNRRAWRTFGHRKERSAPTGYGEAGRSPLRGAAANRRSQLCLRV